MDFCYEPVTVKGKLVFLTNFPDVPALKNATVKTLDNGIKAVACEIISYNSNGSFNFCLPI